MLLNSNRMCWLPEKLDFKLWFGNPNAKITFLLERYRRKLIRHGKQIIPLSSVLFSYWALSFITGKIFLFFLENKETKNLTTSKNWDVFVVSENCTVLFVLQSEGIFLFLATKCSCILLYHRFATGKKKKSRKSQQWNTYLTK